MTTRLKILLSVLGLLIAFVIGRNSVNTDKTTETKTNTQDKTDTSTHTVTKTVITKVPDGTTTTTTTTDTTQDIKQTDKIIADNTTQTSEKPQITVSLLAATNIVHPITTPISYGLSLQKQFLGLSVGVWGLTTGTAGISLGLSF